MSSFNRMQRSLFWRPRRTCSGRSIFISCIETLATRFARRCNSCSSEERRLTSNSSPNSGSETTAAAVGSVSGRVSGSVCSSSLVETGRGSLGAEQRRERVAGLVAGAGGNNVVDGVMQLFRRTLDALQIVPKRADDRLLYGAGFLCHTGFRGAFAHKFPVLAFWKVGGLESTGGGYRCAQLLLNQQGQLTVFGCQTKRAKTSR